MRPALPLSAVPEEMLMILPDFCRRMVGSTARVQKNKPFKFTSIMRSHSPGSMVSMPPRFIGIVAKIAALLTSTSIRPNLSSASLAMSFVDVSLATSVFAANALPSNC